MSYRVGTPNYNLPQTEGNDLRDWFDTNEPFRRVDADLHSTKQGVESQGATIEAMQIDIGNNTQGLADANGEIADIKVKQATDEENIAQNGQAISRIETKVDEQGTDLAEMIEVTEEESATASVQHNVGTYFRYNDNLWITTVLIRVGDEIVPNVNCETTDVMSRVYNLEHSGGSEVSADAVSFDSTGTDIGATNVEDAIKNVRNKIPADVGDIPTIQQDVSDIKSNLTASDDLEFKFTKSGSAYGYEDGDGNFVPFKNPVGTKSITANGTYDVTDYASAEVNVPNPSLSFQTYFNNQSISGSRTLNCNVGDVIIYAGSITVSNVTPLGTLTKDGTFNFAIANTATVTANCTGYCSAGRIYQS